MASDSPGSYSKSHHVNDSHDCHVISGLLPDNGGPRGTFPMNVIGGFQRDSTFTVKDSGYYVSTSDGASTCSSSTTEAGELEGGTLLVLEPKSLRSFTTNDEYLYAMKEDLADWFSCLYQRDDITADNFFQILDTGVLLCKHANKVQEFARQRREMGEALEMRSYFIRSVPAGNVSYREGVKPETFQARDNISNFISWGRQLGIPEVLSFETDDLVLRKNEKSVILCLLEIARIGAKLGMLAPTLIQMEQEIDAELAGEEPKPQIQIITCDMRSLDERVRDLIGRCTCPVQFPMIKVGEGKYKIGDSRSLIFVRILRNHVMVRVGGGWDTLENYLNKHDPCQCLYRGHRPSGATHKVVVTQQKQQVPSSNASPRPAPNTPASPRRASSASVGRHRSSSPQSGSKAPTLVISRDLPVPSKSAPNTGSHAKGARATSSQTAHKNLQASDEWSNSSAQQPRCNSPSPSRHRSPSPRTASQSLPQPSSARRRSSGAPHVGGQDHRIWMGRKDAADSKRYFDVKVNPPSANVEHGRECDSIAGAMDGAAKTSVNIDKISTMTLTEFKSLLHSALAVPEEQKPDIVEGRSLEQLHNTSSFRRNSDATSNADLSRPKTPGTISRPKTPKTFSEQERNPPKEEYKMARPKMPSQIKRDAVAKVAGAISNWVDSRNEVNAEDPTSNRQKAPERPKTLIGPQSNLQTENNNNNYVDSCDMAASSLMIPANPARDRPSTPSRIPKPSFIPRPKTPNSLLHDSPTEASSQMNFSSLQGPTSNLTKVNIASVNRPTALSRSNSNSSSVKSVDEAPVSPASSFTEDRMFKSHTRTRRLSNSSDSFNTNNNATSSSPVNTGRSYKDIYTAKRAVASGTDSRVPPTRAVTPGPREKWTLAGVSSSISETPTSSNIQRRRSVNTIDKQNLPKSVSGSRHNPSATNIETEQQMTITNEITFSDDEEINELVKTAAMNSRSQNSRSSSADARKFPQHNPGRDGDEVLMIHRDQQTKLSMNSGSAPRYTVIRRPASRGSSTDRASPTTVGARLFQPHKSSKPQERTSAVGKNKEAHEGDDAPTSQTGDKNRTEAWVDSTLSDNKRKSAPRSKHSKAYEILASELASRPLEEIQALLAEPNNGFVHVNTGSLDPPPEDPEMFRKMEKLYEKYREIELRASVNETTGGERVNTANKSADARSAKSDNQRLVRRTSKASSSTSKTCKSPVSFSGHSSGHATVVSSSGRTSSPVDNKFMKSSSTLFQSQQQRSLSNNTSTLASPSQEMKDSFSLDYATNIDTLSQNMTGPDTDHRGLGVLQDIDPEIARNPAALISKIKEILKVRPRKDENTKGTTRIPAPAALNKYNRSKSVSNLYSEVVSSCTTNIHSSKQPDGGMDPLTDSGPADDELNNESRSCRKSSTMLFGPNTYDDVDQVPDLNTTWSFHGDSTEGQNRTDTPVPKMSTPLTTGRSTLISRRGDRFGRMSQDKENLSSSTVSNLLSPTEGEPDFV